ncbi:MAG: hypothetical protein ACKO2G_14690 [Verrucomicrobiales bacterium]
MSVAEIQKAIQGLSTEERRRLAAWLVMLRHQDLAEYRKSLARKIDDGNPENWVSLEEYDRRVSS